MKSENQSIEFPSDSVIHCDINDSWTRMITCPTYLPECENPWSWSHNCKCVVDESSGCVEETDDGALDEDLEVSRDLCFKD